MIEENSIEKHHIHPKFMDNPKGNGMIISLKRKNHIILHLKIPTIIWKYVPKNSKKRCISEIIDFSKNEIKKLKNIKNQNFFDDTNIICEKCNYNNDIENNYCNRCDSVLLNNIKNQNEYY